MLKPRGACLVPQRQPSSVLLYSPRSLHPAAASAARQRAAAASTAHALGGTPSRTAGVVEQQASAPAVEQAAGHHHHPPLPPGDHPVLDLLKQRLAEGSRPGHRTDGLKLGLVVEGGGMRGIVTGELVPRVLPIQIRCNGHHKLKPSFLQPYPAACMSPTTATPPLNRTQQAPC